MSEHLENSNTVTVLSVIGFIFGLMGMLASFIPLIGLLAFYIGVPAAILSGIACYVAKAKKVKQTFAITALTVSVIGVSVSTWQYCTIVSMAKHLNNQTKQMLQNSPENKALPNTEAENYSFKVIDPANKNK